jgi:hypothetical protein
MYLITVCSSKSLNKFQSLSSNSISISTTSLSSLNSGQILHQGSAIFSSNRNFILVLQKDGNLVILNTLTNNPIWSSNTSEKGQGPYQLALLYTGNLVIYDIFNGMIWATAISSSPSDGYVLKLSDEGILTIRDAYNDEVWSTSSDQNVSDVNTLKLQESPSVRNSLSVGRTLYTGMSLTSQNSVYNATLLSNGRFQLTRTEVNSRGEVIWNNSTNTFEVHYPKVTTLVWSSQSPYFQNGNFTLTLQSNGILSIFDFNNTAVWNSHSYSSPEANYTLLLTNNGNLIISNGNNSIWDIQGNINIFDQTVNVLNSGSSISSGNSLVTPDRQYALQLLNNGNLELNYFPGNTSVKTTIWETNTANIGSYPFKLIMDRSGKLMIVDSEKSVLWTSKTKSPLSKLSLEENGQVIILNSDSTIIYQLFVSTSFTFPVKLSNFPRNKVFHRSALYVNQELRIGGILTSRNLNYQLRLSKNGNLDILYYPETVTYHHNHTSIWTPNLLRNSKSASRLSLRNDGNLVLFNGQNSSIWISGSSSRKSNNFYLWISNSGSLRIMNSKTNSLIWKLIMKRRKPSLKVKSTVLIQGKSLKQGFSIVSNNKKYALTVGKGDLNLVYYQNTISDLSVNKTIWSTHTNNTGRAPYKLKLMKNGNLILIDSVGLLIWQSNSNGPSNSSYFLSVQDDGEVAIFNSNLIPIWDTKEYFKNFHKKPVHKLKNGTNSTHSNSTSHLFKLSEGGALLQNESLWSFNNKFQLKITPSGNIVIANRNTSQDIWSSNTRGNHSGPFKLVLSNTGNLVLLDKNRTVVWQTNSAGKPNKNYFAFISDKGNLVIYRNEYEAVWDSRGKVQSYKAKISPSFLTEGTFLKSNFSLYSENKKFTLDLNSNGNLVIYSYPINYYIPDGRVQIWSSNTTNKGTTPYKFTLRGNGNLVLTDKYGKVIWSTGTRSNVHKNYIAKLQDNGLLTIFQGNKILWDSKVGLYKITNSSRSRSLKPLLKKINSKRSEIKSHTIRIGRDVLAQNEELLENDSLFSSNNKYTVEISNNANLNIYHYPETVENLHIRTLVWSSNTVTNLNGPFKLILRPSGNLNIVTQYEEKKVWSSYMGRKKGHYYAKIENSGNFVVYKSKNNQPVWDTMGTVSSKHTNLLNSIKLKPFLLVGKTLKEGSSIFSDNLKYCLELQSDGNLVIFNYPKGIHKDLNTRSIIWSSNSYTTEGGPFSLTLQRDGVITVLDNFNNVVWRSNSKQPKHSSKYYLKLLDDGNLVIMDKSVKPVWDLNNQYYHATNTFKTNTLLAGQYILMGNSLYSANKQYSLDVQFDGNLVIYKYPSGLTNLNNRQPIWFTNNNLMMYGNHPYKLKLTLNGNLFLLDKYKNIIWSSETNGRKKNLNYKLVLEDSGKLVILNHHYEPIWSSF